MDDLGLTLGIDTSFLGNDSRSSAYLRRMYDIGCIQLVASTVLRREIEISDKAWLHDEASLYPIYLEVLTLDESRLGEAVLASEADVELAAELKGIIAPGGGTSTERDIIHLHTAIRYGADALVTTDEDDILRPSEKLAHLIAVWRPERAARVVSGLRASARRRCRR